MKTSSRFALGSFLALIAALVTYVRAIWVGHFYDLRPADEFCTGKTLASRPLDWHLFPPSQQCRWSDGTTTDLVPLSLNIALFGLLALAAVLAVLATLGRTTSPRRRSETPHE